MLRPLEQMAGQAVPVAQMEPEAERRMAEVERQMAEAVRRKAEAVRRKAAEAEPVPEPVQQTALEPVPVAERRMESEVEHRMVVR